MRTDPGVKKAAEFLHAGGVVAFPTETSYGLAASIRSLSALERIFRMKRRPKEKPLLVLVSGIPDLMGLTGEIPEEAIPLMDSLWPGPLTILFSALSDLPWPLTGSTGRIGVRVSSHPLAQALVAATGSPITATSANLSGLAPACDPKEIRRQFAEDPPDAILDGGRTAGGPPSTIVDVTTSPVHIVREGAISEGTIRRLIRERETSAP